MTDLPHVEARFRAAVAAMPPASRSYMLDVLTLPAGDRAREIGGLHRSVVTPALAELLIDLEEEPAARAAVVGALREMSRDST